MTDGRNRDNTHAVIMRYDVASPDWSVLSSQATLELMNSTHSTAQHGTAQRIYNTHQVMKRQNGSNMFGCGTYPRTQ